MFTRPYSGARVLAGSPQLVALALMVAAARQAMRLGRFLGPRAEMAVLPNHNRSAPGVMRIEPALLPRRHESIMNMRRRDFLVPGLPCKHEGRLDIERSEARAPLLRPR